MIDDAPTAVELEAELTRLRAAFGELESGIAAAFLGQSEVLRLLLECLLARGHVLLESAPGLGKTTLVKSLAAALDLKFRRIQFTPDLMPADVIGTRVLEQSESGTRHFVHHDGPIFCQVLLADEINRATPRTQAALLEAMQERQVTLFDGSRALDPAFFVVATQNPIEMEGTYPLPEAQLDRFIAKVSIAAPSESALIEILRATTGPLHADVAAVLEPSDLERARQLCRDLPVANDVLRFAARIVRATDPSDDSAPADVRANVRHGASPRGAQALIELAKSRAFLNGELHVTEDDVAAVAVPALRHRLIPSYEGEARGVDPDELIRAAVAAVRPR